MTLRGLVTLPLEVIVDKLIRMPGTGPGRRNQASAALSIFSQQGHFNFNIERASRKATAKDAQTNKLEHGRGMR